MGTALEYQSGYRYVQIPRAHIKASHYSTALQLHVHKGPRDAHPKEGKRRITRAAFLFSLPYVTSEYNRILFKCRRARVEPREREAAAAPAKKTTSGDRWPHRCVTHARCYCNSPGATRDFLGADNRERESWRKAVRDGTIALYSSLYNTLILNENSHIDQRLAQFLTSQRSFFRFASPARVQVPPIARAKIRARDSV